jgi:hypothetical protein
VLSNLPGVACAHPRCSILAASNMPMPSPTCRDAHDGRAVNQLIDYQLIAILIDYFNYQFNYLKPTSISISISSCHWRPIELSTN